MRDMGIVSIRYRAQCRAKRERIALQDGLYMFLKSTGSGYNGLIQCLDSALESETGASMTESQRLAKKLREM